MIKKFVSLTLGLILTMAMGSSLAAIPSTINFATEATFPPFEYVDASGQVKGFEIDLANALCQQMKVKCTYANQPWVSLIPSLKIGKYQAVISAMNITSERQKIVDFTKPYFHTTISFVVPVGSKLVISDQGLKGKTIGVQIGTISSDYLRAKYGNAVKFKTYPNQQEALLDLIAGRVDAVLGETAVTLTWLQEHGMDKKYVFAGKPIYEPALFGEGYGIAVRKGDRELLDAFNTALAEIKANGTYDRISAAYFRK